MSKVFNLSKRFGRFQTLCRIKYLNIRGKKIIIGPGSVISRHADLVCSKYPLVIGRDCYISSYTILRSDHGPIQIGNNTTVGAFCMVHGNCTIGNAVRIASHITIVASNHHYRKKEILIKNQGEMSLGIHIDNDVWIGSGVQVLDGAHINEGCVIGAGSVVKGNLEAYGVYVGSPARKISVRE